MELREITVKSKWFFLIICSIILWFVWSQLRPALVRRNCQELAYQRGDEYFSNAFLQNESALNKSQLQEQYMERTYNRCLHQNGLE